MKPRVRNTHPIERSSLYRLRSMGRLQKLLNCSTAIFDSALEQTASYKCWGTKQKPVDKLLGIPHKSRDVQEPKGALAYVQRRLANLLSRIERPDYVHSARKKRSYVTNASQHEASTGLLTIDIKSFYTKARATYVYNFYRTRLQCSARIAQTLTKLSIYNQHLPTGSSLSPVLSFFTYQDMFDEISLTAQRLEAKFTLYVDDMTLSGEKVTKSLLSSIVPLIQRRGLSSHKYHFTSAMTPRVVTGVAITSEGLFMPNKRMKKIRLLLEMLRHNQPIGRRRRLSRNERSSIRSSLLGQYREAMGINRTYSEDASKMEARLRTRHYL